MNESPELRHRHSGLLSLLTFWHVAIFVVTTSWMFGGKIDWAKVPLSLWGTLSLGLTIAGFMSRRNQGQPLIRPLLWLLPALLLGLQIVTSAFNLNFRVVPLFDSLVYRPVAPLTWLPSGAKPVEALSELWLLFGLYLSGFTLALNVSSIRLLQRLMLVLAMNTTVLAVFGTLQELVHADMFFGWVKSPNPTFFGTFVYHNHWGPFALMGIMMWFALVPSLAGRDAGRGFYHSPAVGALVAALLIAVTIPMTTSRSGTMMLGVILLGITVVESRRVITRTRRRGGSARAKVAGLCLATVLVAGAVYYMGGKTIRARIADTRSQLAAMKTQGSIGERATIYTTSLEIWRDKPWFGWGLESWELLHRRRTPLTDRGDGIPIYYREAHSDWLCALAETGGVGTLLLLAMGIVPLWSMRRQLKGSAFSLHLLAVNLLIALYAWVEFPLANPAVVLTYWVVLFTAVRHARLSAH